MHISFAPLFFLAKENGLTYERLGGLLGVSPSMLTQMRKGGFNGNSGARVGIIARACELFSCGIDGIISLEADEEVPVEAPKRIVLHKEFCECEDPLEACKVELV